MTWNINNFACLSRSSGGGTVTFGDDSKGKIIGIDNIKIDASPLIQNIALVEVLKHNILSICQLCEKGLRVIFDNSTCDIVGRKSNSRVLSVFMKIML